MLLVISFDVWNTLVRTGIIYRRLAEVVAESVNENPSNIEKTIYDVYTKVKKIRLTGNQTDVHKFISTSRTLLAKALGISYDDLVEAIDITFSSIMDVTYALPDFTKVLYNDVMPALNSIKSIDVKVGVISNNVFWESIYTRRLLRFLELDKYFKTQVYSDEIGAFKPDKRIFLEFCRRIGVDASKVIHVGDSVAEDIGGALSVGMKAMYIDRSRKEKNVIIDIGLVLTNSLEDIVEALQVLG